MLLLCSGVWVYSGIVCPLELLVQQVTDNCRGVQASAAEEGCKTLSSLTIFVVNSLGFCLMIIWNIYLMFSPRVGFIFIFLFILMISTSDQRIFFTRHLMLADIPVWFFFNLSFFLLGNSSNTVEYFFMKLVWRNTANIQEHILIWWCFKIFSIFEISYLDYFTCGVFVWAVKLKLSHLYSLNYTSASTICWSFAFSDLENYINLEWFVLLWQLMWCFEKSVNTFFQARFVCLIISNWLLIVKNFYSCNSAQRPERYSSPSSSNYSSVYFFTLFTFFFFISFHVLVQRWT